LQKISYVLCDEHAALSYFDDNAEKLKRFLAIAAEKKRQKFQYIYFLLFFLFGFPLFLLAYLRKLMHLGLLIIMFR